MLKLVISDDEGKTTVVPLVRDEITIGRKEGNTIRLTERNVSRRHARLSKRSGDYVIEDLASYNGIVLNGARLAELRQIRHGDQILIGDYKLQIVEDATIQPTMQPSPPAPPSEPIVPLLAGPPPAPPPTLGTVAPGQQQPNLPAGLEALNNPFAPVTRPAAAIATVTGNEIPEAIRTLRLVFLAPAGVPAPVMLDKLPLVMGRSEAADIALPFSSISREHARVFLQDGKLLIEDLGSSNGVQVNGEKVREAELGPGDMVQLGVVEFRVARRGDSTVVIQKLVADEKRAQQRNPVLLGGAVLLAGAVLGGALFMAFHRTPDAQTITPIATQTQPQQPATPTPIVVPTPVPSAPAPTPTPNPAAVAAPPTPAVEPPTPAPQVDPTPTPPTPTPAVEPPPPTAETGPQTLAAPTPDRSHRPRTANPRPTPTPTPTVAAPAPPPPLPPPPTPRPQPAAAASGASGMDGARDCLRSGGPDANNCAIRALQGHTTDEASLGLLCTTYRSAGQRDNAIRCMRNYIRTYPDGRRVQGFQTFLDGN